MHVDQHCVQVDIVFRKHPLIVHRVGQLPWFSVSSSCAVSLESGGTVRS
jgi:hypothetical protein